MIERKGFHYFKGIKIDFKVYWKNNQISFTWIKNVIFDTSIRDSLFIIITKV